MSTLIPEQGNALTAEWLPEYWNGDGWAPIYWIHDPISMEKALSICHRLRRDPSVEAPLRLRNARTGHTIVTGP